MILNKCINAILTINCSQAFDNTIHFVMKKMRKKKKEERRVLRLLHLELIKLIYFHAVLLVLKDSTVLNVLLTYNSCDEDLC